ncbi:MAG: radical SAM family heme chaperone HemW [Clostridiales Family XIII bacterium]|jgi:oxygen-independent coproporphyrinogen-3 oxidase|nr:radical SAM family heme chaperone HemW [Clostridiales Family XIII bacterium]
MKYAVRQEGKRALGLYVHIPFCVRKCRYCDFCSLPVQDPDLHKEYVRKLTTEITLKRKLFPAHEVDSIYFGGGTPSSIDPSLIEGLIDAAVARYPVADDCEITLEANPGSLTDKSLRAYKAMGVNRMSIGVQSFQDKQLEFLGRIHTAEEALLSCLGAEAAGFCNISIDLIFGVPGQAHNDWLYSLDIARQLPVQHISFYSLQIEEGTPLHADVEAGRVEPVEDIEDRLMYHLAIRFLRDKGYQHYEISNCALPGFESRHNMKYWSMEDYAGFGLGAHSYVTKYTKDGRPRGLRLANTERLGDYLAARDAYSMLDAMHENTVGDQLSEYVFLGLRRTAGIDLAHFKEVFGSDFWEKYGEETSKLIQQGLLERSDERLKLTERGLDVANRVFSEYV